VQFNRDITRACVSLIDQIQQNRETLKKLLTCLNPRPSSATDLSPTFINPEGGYRRTCEIAGKSGKQIERCVLSLFQIAESLGFKGKLRQSEDPLRIGD
jgi:hypothetical protein